MRFMRANTIITPPARAMAPPESPVPAPRPTMGTSCVLASFTISETCRVVVGKTTASGKDFSMEPSYSYINNSSGSESTEAGPRRVCSSRMKSLFMDDAFERSQRLERHFDFARQRAKRQALENVSCHYSESPGGCAT